MHQPLRCDCGDPECPSCGVAQGTYGGHEGGPAKALFQVLPPDAGIFDAALNRKAVYLVLQALRSVERPTFKSMGEVLQMDPTRVRRLLEVLDLLPAFKDARARAGIAGARATQARLKRSANHDPLD